MSSKPTYYDMAENNYNFLQNIRDNHLINNCICSIAQDTCEYYLKHVISLCYYNEDVIDIMQSHSLKKLKNFTMDKVPNFFVNWDKILKADGYHYMAQYSNFDIFMVNDIDIEDCYIAVDEAHCGATSFCKYEQYNEHAPFPKEGMLQDIPKHRIKGETSLNFQFERNI